MDSEIVKNKEVEINKEDTKNEQDEKDEKLNKNKEFMVNEETIELDDVLVNELGQFGRFQTRTLCLLAVPFLLCAFSTEYIFSAAKITHRCQIPECGENSKDALFEPNWIHNAIPTSGAVFASCERYQPVASNGSLDYCPAALFDESLIVTCDGFVYNRTNSIVYDFDLGCSEWLRALAGTMNSVGDLLVLPLVGYISDRFGRRIALVSTSFFMALFGLARAFSTSYTMYLVFHLLQTTFGGGIYSSAYVFAAELVGPKYRVLTSAVCSSMFALSQVIMGFIAWLVQPWRYMILTLHIPCFILVSYYWIMSESVRWLLSKKKFEEAKTILLRVAKVNKTKINVNSLNALLKSYSSENKNRPSPISYILHSPTLLRRVCTTPIWWITTTFVYYGLSINSVSLSESMYFNYILTVAIEIPGYVTAVLTLDRFGRRNTIATAFFLCAACNLAFAFIDQDLTELRLCLFLLGKYAISIVFTSVYLYTSELYPTEYRHSLLGFSSMLGRIGSITAPLTPVLMEYWAGIPSLMFAGFSLVSGALVLTQPETLGAKLPDTLADSELIGRKTS